MSRTVVPALLAAVAGLGLWLGTAAPARAQFYQAPPQPAYAPMDKFWYYPYYTFPHNYWPATAPRYPASGNCRYPAYMAYPPFQEPHWRYDLWEPMNYYRGFHFWLDQL